jgi:type II secretory pathway pseudopilin PulG
MNQRIKTTRRGITLTEILISIMIMGIGLVSIATLFPLGLLRIREANRNTRGALLAETAASDATARNLLQPFTFTNSWYTVFSPFSFDAPPGFLTTLTNNPAGAVRTGGPGIPVAYDPLWWSVVHQVSAQTQATPVTPITADALYPNVMVRFGQGIGFVRPDPNPGNGSTSPSAHGLQRVTNFIPASMAIGPYATWPFIYAGLNGFDVAGDTFTSRDDIVMQSGQGSEANAILGIGSPVVPSMYDPLTKNFVGATNDWSYSWMITGRMSEASEGTMFDGDIVVFQNRPLALDPIVSPFNGPMQVPQGERVVEAIYGVPGGGNKSIILRWPASMPDPDVKVGNWIADVTYERYTVDEVIRFVSTSQPSQRCYWYQVAKRTPVTPSSISTDPVPHNQMTVAVSSPLQARTPVDQNNEPIHVNVALICPYVINVYPRTFYIR